MTITPFPLLRRSEITSRWSFSDSKLWVAVRCLNCTVSSSSRPTASPTASVLAAMTMRDGSSLDSWKSLVMVSSVLMSVEAGHTKSLRSSAVCTTHNIQCFGFFVFCCFLHLGSLYALKRDVHTSQTRCKSAVL